jgi:hypothetical protein
MAAVLIFSVGCGNSDQELVKSNYKELNGPEGVTLTIKEDTLSNSGATLVFQNDSDTEYIFGSAFEIEKMESDVWYKQPTITEACFNQLGYGLSPRGTAEIETDWEWLYGKLDKGKYRIIKTIGEKGNRVSDFDLSVFFTIK